MKAHIVTIILFLACIIGIGVITRFFLLNPFGVIICVLFGFFFIILVVIMGDAYMRTLDWAKIWVKKHWQ